MTQGDDEMQRFLDEDYGRGDITSELLVPKELEANGEIKMKQEGVVAGVEEVSTLFSKLGLKQNWSVTDGSTVRLGDVLVQVWGNARSILAVERVALNVLGHMSGVATATKSAVDIVNRINPAVKVSGTRKTLPGLRHMEKRAIKLGGGEPHRSDLHDMVLIKDNHLALIGTISNAVRNIQLSMPDEGGKVEVEVNSSDGAVEAARSGANIIMLDNMSVDEVIQARMQLEKQGLRQKVVLEVSGGIGFDNLEAYARAGIDVISMGILTNSIAVVDMSFKIRRA